MYDWNGGSWSQVGSQINGPSSNYYFGSSIALNGAGDRLIIGSYNSTEHIATVLMDLPGLRWEVFVWKYLVWLVCRHERCRRCDSGF